MINPRPVGGGAKRPPAPFPLYLLKCCSYTHTQSFRTLSHINFTRVNQFFFEGPDTLAKNDVIVTSCFYVFD